MRIFIFLNLLVLILKLTPAYPKDLFKRYDLDFSGRLIFYHAEDFNHDNKKDILLFLKKGEEYQPGEKWFSLFFQTEHGFSATSDQTFKLDKRVILFDIGDVAGDGKKELVFFLPGGLYYYALSDSGFALEPMKLFDSESIFMLGTNHLTNKWDFVADLNSDAVDEILVPEISQCKIYFRASTTTDWSKVEIPIAAESRAIGFFDPRFSVGNRATVLYSVPYLFFEDFNADNRKDLMAVYADSLVISLQDGNGFFSQNPQRVALKPAEIWRGAKIRHTRLGDKSERTFLMRIADLNDDGIIDAVYIKVSTKESIINPRNEIQLHYGKTGMANGASRVYFNREPDQIIEPDGIQLVLDIIDLNQDGKLDLMIPVVKVGLSNIIKMLLQKRVEIQDEIYLMTADGVYPQKPDLKRKMIMQFSYRGGATSPVYEIADFNGDGQLDVLSSLEERMLLFFWGDKNNVLENTVGGKFNILLPQDGDLVRAIELNGDNKSDVIIHYGEDNPAHKDLKNKLTVLIAN